MELRKLCLSSVMFLALLAAPLLAQVPVSTDVRDLDVAYPAIEYRISALAVPPGHDGLVAVRNDGHGWMMVTMQWYADNLTLIPGAAESFWVKRHDLVIFYSTTPRLDPALRKRYLSAMVILRQDTRGVSVSGYFYDRDMHGKTPMTWEKFEPAEIGNLYP